MKKPAKTTKRVTVAVKETPAKKSPVKEVAKKVAVAPVVVQTAPNTKMSPIMGVVLVLLILLAAGLFLYDRFGAIAVVNGMPISRLDYYQTMDKQVGKQILDKMVTESLILNAADKAGLTIDQATISAEVAKTEAGLKAQGQTLASALAQENMTQADLERLIKIQKIAETLSKSEAASVSAAQVDQFIAANKDQMPKNLKPEELRAMAEQELASQADSNNINTWVTKLKSGATIVYK